MAKLYQNWDGTYTPDKAMLRDIDRAHTEAQWDREQAETWNGMAGNVLRETASDLAVVGGLAVGAVVFPHLRYILQALLHFPMAWVVAWFILNEFTGLQPLSALGYSVLISIVWSGLYIALRTIPKLNRGF